MLAALYSCESILRKGHGGQMAFSQLVWVKQSHDTNVCPLTQQRIEDGHCHRRINKQKASGQESELAFWCFCLVFLCKKKRLHNSNISRPLTRKNLFTSPVFAFLSRTLSGSLWLFLCRRRPLQMSYYPPTERPLVGMTAEISRATGAQAAAPPVR